MANRIEDNKKYDLDEIRYITTENPADLLTRSNFESLVPETRLYGPSWLSSDEHDWPKNNFSNLEPIKEISQATLISRSFITESNWQVLKNYCFLHEVSISFQLKKSMSLILLKLTSYDYDMSKEYISRVSNKIAKLN